MGQVEPTPDKESLSSRIVLLLALLLLNSIVYQFAMYMSFSGGMSALGIGLAVIYIGFILFAMYQRRLSLVSIVVQLSLSVAFFNLNTDFVLSDGAPPGVAYIKKYITLLLVASQFLAPMRFISRGAYRTMLWCVAGLFVIYALAALGASIFEQENAFLAGGYEALGDRALGPERWSLIFRQSCVTAAILAGMIVLSFSRRGDWPADRKRNPKAVRTVAPRRKA